MAVVLEDSSPMNDPSFAMREESTGVSGTVVVDNDDKS